MPTQRSQQSVTTWTSIVPPIKLSTTISNPSMCASRGSMLFKYTVSTHTASMFLLSSSIVLRSSTTYSGNIVRRMWYRRLIFLVIVNIINDCEGVTNAIFNEQIRDYSVSNDVSNSWNYIWPKDVYKSNSVPLFR